ncbi:MAG: TRAP transporter large permease [Vicinamibacteria bacterium]
MRLLGRLHAAENAALVAALAAATLLPLVDMAGRPFGGFHVPGGAEYLRQLTLWLAFVGGLVTAREGKHLTLSTTEFLGRGAFSRAARGLTGALAAATAAVLAYASWQVVQANRQDVKLLPGGLPQWVSELVMPVCLALIAARFAARAGGWRARIGALAAVGAAFGLGLFPERAAGLAWPLGLGILAVSSLGAPIFAIMGSLALLLFFKDGTPVAAVTAEVYRLISSPTLPAIPLLTAAGYLLAEGGASTRLLRFFRALLGWMPGGLAVVTAAACALFTTFTGGSGVTIIALGGLLLPMLLEEKYDEGFSLGLVTAAGSLGLLFPPSLPVILYSVVASAGDTQVPADELYLAGLVPGLLMVLIVAAYGVLRGLRLPGSRRPFHPRELVAAAWAAKWELLLPLFVVGLFVSGLASMVETAAAAVAFTVLTQSLLQRDVPFRRLPAVLVKAGTLMGAVLLLLAVAMGLTAYLVDALIAEQLLGWVKTHIHSPLVFLAALNVLLLVVGCLVDIFSAIVIVVPLIAPIGLAFGIHPLHLGVIFLANLELGFLTPPIGMNLFLASSRFGVPLLRVYRDTLPFLLILLLGVLLITYVPALSVGVVQFLGKGAFAPVAP